MTKLRLSNRKGAHGALPSFVSEGFSSACRLRWRTNGESRKKSARSRPNSRCQSRSACRSPAIGRDHRGSIDVEIRCRDRDACAGPLAIHLVCRIAALSNKGRAGQAHALLILPLAALGAVMFAIGRLSARYRRKQTTVQAPLTSVLVSFVSFAVVLLAFILTRRLGY